MMHIRRLAPEARLSGAVVHAGTVYLAGQVADDSGADAFGQTLDILRQIDRLLADAGTDKQHLLSVQVVLADLKDFPAMNRAWDAWLDTAHKPARMHQNVSNSSGLVARPHQKPTTTSVICNPSRIIPKRSSLSPGLGYRIVYLHFVSFRLLPRMTWDILRFVLGRQDK